MRLSMLVDEAIRLDAASDREVSGLAADSRSVRPGDVFAALPGTRAHGLTFLAEALARGAVAVLVGDADAARVPGDVPKLIAADPRQAFARLAARFHPGRPNVIAAVTGTNGKSSTVSFARQLWQHAGLHAASLGTLGLEPAGLGETGGLTTPDALTLHRTLDRLARLGVTHLALEASSHGLDQRRLDGLAVDIAAFTNLSRDHFDYHGSVEAYFRAKARLFEVLLRPGGTAVLDADVPEFPRLAAMVAERGARLLTYGRNGRDFRLLAGAERPDGLGLRLLLAGEELSVEVPLYGSFQAWNILCAAAIAYASGVPLAVLRQAIPRLSGVRGRMQLVARAPSGGRLFVDYAHTPDALEKALAALRRHVAGRIVVVFGCGGDRDPGKRPLMGEIATRAADLVIVTDDNPRSEDPARIRAQILAGCGPEAREVGDRAEAIAAGIAAVGRDDALLVAGKGHERGQVIGRQVLPFDDIEMVQRLARAGSAP
ncbi:UDP-N-acetylmuramoyl-L-alanyl-D-glutamate--2, 6-diaminopimelate ligase [bacterium HR40]|nr:UDP-N-acetylmuramoyl-L-alanyl-D-glutamate--2, 6-diaminopimelate ligase [bacterium HR40]